MDNIMSQIMENLKINYDEEQSNIKYNLYFFNGIPIPNNIEIKNVTYYGFDLSWNIDNNSINIK